MVKMVDHPMWQDKVVVSTKVAAKPIHRSHTSNTEAIKYNICDCGKPENSALYEKSKKKTQPTSDRKGSVNQD